MRKDITLLFSLSKIIDFNFFTMMNLVPVMSIKLKNNSNNNNNNMINSPRRGPKKISKNMRLLDKVSIALTIRDINILKS
jgi:hypothetical protein